MKILLTGGNGFLGSCIFKFLNKNNEVHTLSRNNAYYTCNLKYEIPELKNNYDLIIHAAGKAHSIATNEIEKKEFYQINVQGTNNLLAALTKFKVPKYFIYISSVSVYGLLKGEMISESTSLNAIDPYGKSKIEAEEVIKIWCKEKNVICTILRLPLVVGDNPPGNLGAMFRGIEKGYYFNIAGGKAKKSMVLASDIAKYILKAAEVGGTYNLTDGIHPNFYELSKRMAHNLDKSFVPNMPISIAKILAKIGDILGKNFPINSDKLSKITSTLTFDDSKARIYFGWNPTPVLNDTKFTNESII